MSWWSLRLMKETPRPSRASIPVASGVGGSIVISKGEGRTCGKNQIHDEITLRPEDPILEHGSGPMGVCMSFPFAHAQLATPLLIL